MIKKVFKIMVKILLILLVVQIMKVPRVEAISWDEIFQSGEDFIYEGKSSSRANEAINTEQLKDMSSNIFNILVTLGVIFSVIIGVILGIQLMWGSLEQQVKAKEMLLPYGIGCIVIFGAFGIWKLAVTVFSQI